MPGQVAANTGPDLYEYYVRSLGGQVGQPSSETGRPEPVLDKSMADHAGNRLPNPKTGRPGPVLGNSIADYARNRQPNPKTGRPGPALGKTHGR